MSSDFEPLTEREVLTFARNALDMARRYRTTAPAVAAQALTVAGVMRRLWMAEQSARKILAS